MGLVSQVLKVREGIVSFSLKLTIAVGVFRIACEVTMQLLRDNKDSLMSVLDAFIHDPLVEWEDEKRKLVRTLSPSAMFDLKPFESRNGSQLGDLAAKQISSSLPWICGCLPRTP